jgi:hypothetical protein
MPNGGFAARCQALTTDSTSQCKRPASEGKKVCSMHGAGNRTQVESGEKKKPGRPITHGLYSNQPGKSISELAELVRELEVDLDNTDKEMAILKAVLWKALRGAEDYQGSEADLKKILEELAKITPEVVSNPLDLATILTKFEKAAQLVGRLESFYISLTVLAEKVIKASHTRADITVKLAQEKALDLFVKLVGFIRNAVWDTIDDHDLLDKFEIKLRKIALDNGIVISKDDRRDVN